MYIVLVAKEYYYVLKQLFIYYFYYYVDDEKSREGLILYSKYCDEYSSMHLIYLLLYMSR